MIIYKSMVKRANEFKKFYTDSLSSILSRFEEHEAQRIECLKVAADRIIVYETNQDMNNRYDAKAFAKVAENINGDKQIKFFQSKICLLKLEETPDFQFIRLPTYDQRDLQNLSISITSPH